jgi:hypothetical protein
MCGVVLQDIRERCVLHVCHNVSDEATKRIQLQHYLYLAQTIVIFIANNNPSYRVCVSWTYTLAHRFLGLTLKTAGLREIAHWARNVLHFSLNLWLGTFPAHMNIQRVKLEISKKIFTRRFSCKEPTVAIRH